ncbi:hypothetical protein [Leucobacter ruminantium]|uniref:Uncharacterized protein n=1 Tax=Leucobacter ruminantium TaxID=1289170 RepID=A0A939S081_9MICO|nr:hypothetical protein [Leucobacter ruminantium]MBO1806244.1 hypothetical protein [Leucobacter ruminantium]
MGYARLVATAVWVIYGGPLAYLLGRLLRRRPNRWLHRCVFATLGAAVGASSSALFLAPLLAEGAPWPLELIVPATVCAAICVWGGWEFTSSRAHRRDLDPAVQRFGDDEAAEDAAVDRISRVEEPPPPES